MLLRSLMLKQVRQTKERKKKFDVETDVWSHQVRQTKGPFTLYNLTGLGTVPSPVWCNVNASDRARPTQMSCGPGPPRGIRLGPDRRGSARYGL